MAIGAVVPFGVVWYRMRKRLKTFETQLPDLLITIAASLKAGHSFKQGLQAVVDEGSSARVDGVQPRPDRDRPRPLDRRRTHRHGRNGSARSNFEFAITAVTIQRQVGGSLASLFDMVADTVRQRQQFARKIRSLTAMGRMSAYTLIGLPFFLALAISVINPGYLHPLFYTSTGHLLLGIGLGDDGSRVGAPPENRLLQRLIPMPMLLILAAFCIALAALCVGNLATLPARDRRARIRDGSDLRQRSRLGRSGARTLPGAGDQSVRHLARSGDASAQREAEPRIDLDFC